MTLVGSPVHHALHRASDRIAERIVEEQAQTQRLDLLMTQIGIIRHIFTTMTDVPYGVKHNLHVSPIGVGREVYRLFEAVQLCGEWRFDPKPEITEAVVMEAFTHVGTTVGATMPIFPVGNVSPAARRLIIQDPFLQGTREVPWAVYCMHIGEDERRKPVMKIDNELAGPGGFRYIALPPGIEYVDGIWRTFDLN